MSSPLLELSEVTFRYGVHNHTVLDRFSVKVESGTVTTILGPNGAGKTTLLHIILGWLHPQSGHVLLNDQPLRFYSRRQLSQWMGLVPQSEHVPYDYSILEYVLFGRTPYLNPLELPSQDDLQAAIDALEMVGMGEFRKRSISRLSGGERELVLVARALAQQPRILLLDEPTAHLDLSNKNRLLHLLQNLNQQGVTILLTTHEPDVASIISTHMVLVNRGQVLQSGPLDQVFTGDSLSTAYGINVEVRQIEGRRVILWS